MAKMIFNKAIKYNGIKYPQNTVIEINDIDVEGISRDLGGHLILEDKKEKKK